MNASASVKETKKNKIGGWGQAYLQKWRTQPRVCLFRLAQQLFAFGCTFLLGCGRLPYGVYPFGIAFFAASTRFVPFSFLGLLCSALFAQNLGIATVICAVAMLALRYCLRFVKNEQGQVRKAFTEPFLMRLPIALFGGMLLSWYRILAGGFRSYDLSGSFLLLVASGFACMAYCCANGVLQFRYAKELGELALAVSCTYVLRDVLWLGIAPAVVLGWTCTLYASGRHGGAKGCVCGMACGLAVSALSAPSYAIGGLLFGLLYPLSVPLAFAWSVAGAGVYLLFADSLLSVYAALPEWVIAFGLTLLLRQLLPQKAKEEKNYAGILEGAKQEHSRKRLENLSEALSDLSQTFSRLSKRLRKPGVYEVKAVCDHTMRRICGSCPDRAQCKAGKTAGFSQTVQEVSVDLAQKGRMETHLAPPMLMHHCGQLRNVVGELNRAYAELRKQSMEEDTTEVFANDYSAMSQLLRAALDGEQEDFTVDPERTEAVGRAAKRIGFSAKELAVCGTRNVQILANGVDSASVSATQLQKSFEKTLGLPFHPPAFTVQGSGEVQMRMARRPVLAAESASATCPKVGEEVSGDVITSFSTDQDMFYTLLSDGMGSGPDAAVSAGLCKIFLEKMLSCGNARSISMEMLNDLIRNKNNENFATVDLLEVDLLCKEARFLKSGAAPSFVLRSGNLFKIAANTMPVGVMRSLQAEEIKFRLEDKDVILMFSDGIAQSFEDSLWLLGVVTCEWEDDLGAMAKKILSRAKIQNGANDDMTIALIRITDADTDEKK